MNEITNTEIPTWTVDAHVHYYNCYNFSMWIKSITKNLYSIESTGVHAVILAECFHCNAFDNILSAKLSAADIKTDVISNGTHKTIKVYGKNKNYFLIFPGKQISTKENLEIIGWFITDKLPNGQPIRETIQQIKEKCGLPAINWAPGKWLFKRGKVVRSLLDNEPPGSIFVCDTSLRPRGIPLPSLMKYACQKGITVMAGSDTLPFHGEERMSGCYASVFNGYFDENKPAESLFNSLLSLKATYVNRKGKRRNLLSVLISLLRLRWMKTVGI